MFTLDEIAKHHGADKSTSFHGYAPIYDRLFFPMRDLQIRLLEIGIEYGKSMRTWLDYFPKAEVVGVDVNPLVKLDNPRYTEVIADQNNAASMRQIADTHGPFDIVIDDGCHKADAVSVSFKELWPAVKRGGLYIVEDVFTFYHPMYQSKVQGSSWMHNLVDAVHQRGKSFHGAPDYNGPPSGLETELRFVFFSKGLAVMEKA